MKNIKIYISPIVSTSHSRRERETETTLHLIRQNLGADVMVRHRSDGSPVAVGYDGEISISHSRDYVVVVAHPQLRIGVDIEHPRQQLAQIKSKFLSDEEVCESIVDLLHAWTAKEAVYKAAGIKGLTLAEIVVDRTAKIATARGRGYKLSYRYCEDDLICIAVPIL